MREGSIVVLAIIMGLMLAFDMGGPVNKVAYAFMLICVSQGVYSVVAIAAVGIAVPPLGMGLATLIGRKYFTAEERNRQSRAGDGLRWRDRRGDSLCGRRPAARYPAI
jgi:fructose-specific PTS system IIC-like component